MASSPRRSRPTVTRDAGAMIPRSNQKVAPRVSAIVFTSAISARCTAFVACCDVRNLAKIAFVVSTRCRISATILDRTLRR